MKVQEALKAANKWFDDGLPSHDMPTVITAIKSALSELEKCEPVAWRMQTHPRGDYIIQKHKPDSARRDLWEALYTSPQPIEKCEPVAYGFPNTSITGNSNRLMSVRLEIPSDDQYAGALWIPLYTSPISKEREPVGELILDPALLPALKSPLVNWKINLVDLEVGAKFYTSSISKEWVGLSEAQENELSDLAYEKGYGDIELIRSAEAKLKELNTCG